MFPYAAANVHQWHILEGLAGREDVSVEAVNAAFVGTYPREYKDGYIHGGSWDYKGVKVHEVGFLNLFGIRSISRAIGVYRGMVRWWKRHRGEENTAVLYSMITPFMLCLLYTSWSSSKTAITSLSKTTLYRCSSSRTRRFFQRPPWKNTICLLYTSRCV